MDREALIDAMAEALNTCNGSDYTFAELKQHEPQAYKWIIENATAAAGGYAPEGSGDREKIEAARKHFEAIVDLILDSRLDAENVRALIRIEASKGLRVTE